MTTNNFSNEKTLEIWNSTGISVRCIAVFDELNTAVCSGFEIDLSSNLEDLKSYCLDQSKHMIDQYNDNITFAPGERNLIPDDAMPSSMILIKDLDTVPITFFYSKNTLL
jgi:hypothetical protein